MFGHFSIAHVLVLDFGKMFSKRILSIRMLQNVLGAKPMHSTRAGKICAAAFTTTSPVHADISVVESTSSPPASDLTSTILSQADITEPTIAYDLGKLDLTNVNTNISPVREVWVENMSTPNSIKLGILPLNPKIFSVFPRPDLIQLNHRWQMLYKYVDYEKLKTRGEMQATTKKPWPQKGLGRARHGSRVAPQWVGGGWATGPRGPRPFFFMLPWHVRVQGLVSMLASKLAQNDLHVVDSFDGFPADGTADHLNELCTARSWGPSVLFVDKVDSLDESTWQDRPLVQAMKSTEHINFLPSYSLNVYGMLKHETLVLTQDAIEDIQDKLLFQLKRIDLKNVVFRYKPSNLYRF